LPTTNYSGKKEACPVESALTFAEYKPRRTLGAMASKKANSYSRSQMQQLCQQGIKQLDEDRQVLIAKKLLGVARLSNYLSGAVL